MDLQTFRSELRTRLGVPAGDAFWTDPACNQLINAAVHLVETEDDWAWLETTENIVTVNGTDTYPTAATCLRTLAVRSPQNLVLRRMDVREIDGWTGSGTPRIYATFGASLVVRPTPTVVETLLHRFLRTEPELVNAADTPLLPTSYHPAVVEAAAMMAFRRENKTQAAEGAKATYNDWVEQMRRRANRRSDDPGGGAGAEPK